ncbi:MAG: formimidoylglutamase [Bdellovibrionales bacterium]|nr:formimidoylglutamase [Bdellovibrionales bacterium]
MGFKWSLVSIPDHVGVQNVGGRLGAAFGPRAFFESFMRMSGARPDEVPLKQALYQHFSLQPISAIVEENHANAAELVREAAAGADRTVVVGGGHDHGYSHLVGIRDYLGAKKRIGCINIDAHLDVRKPNPKISSGSPFYLALESGVLRGEDLYEFGTQSQCNAADLWRYAHEKNVNIIAFDECRHSNAISNFTQSLEKLARQVDAVVISVDLDSVTEAFAPGVSAPQSEGFSPSELIEFCEVAGANEKVVSLGIFELNPLHDLGGRTARLAATCAFRFLEKARNIRE